MIYTHRKLGTPVNAILFNGPESVEEMGREFCCDVEYHPDAGMAIVCGTEVKRGQFAVETLCAIVAVDRDKLHRRFKAADRQLELFNV